MATLTIPQMIGYAKAAGFTGTPLINIVAIAQAESGGSTTVINSIGAVGVLQILITAHPDVTIAQAQDPAFSFRYAYKLSNGGKNFCPWQSYSSSVCGKSGPSGWNNAWAQFVPRVQAAIGSSTGTGGETRTSGPWEPAYLRDISAWIRNPGLAMYGRWDAPSGAMEGGVDIGSPGGTPVLALADGPIVGAGNFWHSANLYTPGSGNPGYGVVTQRVSVPGYGLNDLYYQHIDIAPNIKTCYAGNCGGQTIKKGQQIGTIRGNVGMLEMGFNANWGGVWGTNHPGKWATDPRPMIKALMEAGPPGGGSSTGVGSTIGLSGTVTGPASYIPLLVQVHNTLVNVPGFHGMALALDEAEQFPGFINLTDPAIAAFGVNFDVVGWVRSVGATCTDNFVPLVVRGDLVMLGTAILFLLLIKVVLDVGEKAGPALMMAGAL